MQDLGVFGQVCGSGFEAGSEWCTGGGYGTGPAQVVGCRRGQEHRSADCRAFRQDHSPGFHVGSSSDIDFDGF